MSKALELRQKAGQVLDDWKKALQERDAETDKEKRSSLNTKVESLKSEHERLMQEVRQHEALEAAEKAAAAEHQADGGRRSGAANPDTPEEKVAKRYSLLRAIRMSAQGKPLDGLEGEMAQEADKEARDSKITLTGNIRIPSFVMQDEQRKEKRDMTAGTDSEGGYTVATNLGQLIPILRPRLVLENLGATMLTGLVGDLDLPRQTGKTSATWEGENDAAAEANITFDKLSLTPKRLAAFVDVSKKLMVQTSNSPENLVRSDLNRAVREALDTAGINGASGGDNPIGILNTSGIGSVALGTNGDEPTWASMISLWKEIAQDDADMNTLAYLTTPGIAAQLMQTEKATGTAQFVWNSNNGNGQVNGYRAATSTLVPSTLTKGTSSGVCHAIIFGDFSQWIIGQWAGIDITVDPYTRAKEAIVVLTVNSFWDMGCRHPQAFAAIKDALLTV